RHALRAEVRVEAQHVVRRNVLRDADHGLDARVNGLVDRVRRKARGDEDQRRVRPGLLDRLGDGVEDGNALDVLAALPGRDAGDDVGAVVAVAEAMEAALAAGQPLHDETRVPVDDDRHYRSLTRALTTIELSVRTPSSMWPESSCRTRSASAAGVSTRASQSSTTGRRSKHATCSIARPASVSRALHSCSE